MGFLIFGLDKYDLEIKVLDKKWLLKVNLKYEFLFCFILMGNEDVDIGGVSIRK